MSMMEGVFREGSAEVDWAEGLDGWFGEDSAGVESGLESGLEAFGVEKVGLLEGETFWHETTVGGAF